MADNEDGTSVEDFLAADEAVADDTSSSTDEEKTDDSSATSEEQQPEDSDGQSQPAKAEGEGEGAGDDETEEEVKPPTEEEIEKQAREALGLPVEETETVETMKRKYAESSKIGIVNAQKVQGFETALGEQGLKPVVTTDAKGKPTVAFIANEQYVQEKLDAADVIKGRTLTASEEQMATDDPLVFAQKLLQEGARAGIEAAVKSPVPNISASDVEIPADIKSLLKAEVASSKNANGDPRCPDFATLDKYIAAVMESDSRMPASLQQLINSDADVYKAVTELVYGQVAHKIAPLIAAQRDETAQLAKKKEKAQEDASMVSDGVRSGKGKPAGPKDEGDEIASAKPMY